MPKKEHSAQLEHAFFALPDGLTVTQLYKMDQEKTSSKPSECTYQFSVEEPEPSSATFHNRDHHFQPPAVQDNDAHFLHYIKVRKLGYLVSSTFGGALKATNVCASYVLACPLASASEATNSLNEGFRVGRGHGHISSSSGSDTEQQVVPLLFIAAGLGLGIILVILMLNSRRHPSSKRPRYSTYNSDGSQAASGEENPQAYPMCVKCKAIFRNDNDLLSHHRLVPRCNGDLSTVAYSDTFPRLTTGSDHRDNHADFGFDHWQENMDQDPSQHINAAAHQVTRMVGLGAPKTVAEILGGFMNTSAFKLAKALQNTGASKAALDELLDLLTSPNFILWHATAIFNSMRVANALVDARIAVPFEEHVIRLSDGSEYIMYSRNVMQVAMFNLEQGRYVGEMAFRPLQSDPGPNFQFTCLPAGGWFQHAYKLLWPAGANEERGLLAINLESDASNVTSLVDGTKLVHPVYFTVGNFLQVDKVNALAHRDICAMLSLFDKRRHRDATKDKRRLLKKELMLKCMEKVIEPFILSQIELSASLGGLQLKPALAMYIADLQEVFKITSVHSKWCPTCLTPEDRFSEFTDCDHTSHAAPDRTVDWTLSKIAEARIKVRNGTWTSDQAGKWLVETGGIDPIALTVNNPFYALHPVTNIFQACVPDRLHLLEKGICKYVMDMIKESLKFVKDGFTSIGKACAAVTHKFSAQPTYVGLRKVHNIMGDTSATMQANQYRWMMRTARANFAEQDIRITTVIDTLINVWKLCRSKSPSRDILSRHLPRAVYLLQSAMKMFKRYSPSGLNFPKFHMLGHLARAAEQFGPLWLQTTEFSEANHKPLKASICHTSFNVGYQQHAGADYLRRQELLRIEKQLEDIEEDRRCALQPKSVEGRVVASAKGKSVASGRLKVTTLRELLTIQSAISATSLPAILEELFGNDVSGMAAKGPVCIRNAMESFLGLQGTLSFLIYNFVLECMERKNPALLEDPNLLSIDCVLDTVEIYTSAIVVLDGGLPVVGNALKQRRKVVANSHNPRRGDDGDLARKIKDVDGGRFDCLRVINHHFKEDQVPHSGNPRELIGRAICFFKIDEKALPQAHWLDSRAGYPDFVLLATFQQQAHIPWCNVTPEQNTYHAAAIQQRGLTSTSAGIQHWQLPRARVEMIPSTFIAGYPNMPPTDAGFNRFIVVPLADVVGFAHMIPATQRTKINQNNDGVNMFFLNSDSDI